MRREVLGAVVAGEVLDLSLADDVSFAPSAVVLPSKVNPFCCVSGFVLREPYVKSGARRTGKAYAARICSCQDIGFTLREEALTMEAHVK